MLIVHESVDEVLWQQLIVNDSMLMLCLRKHWGGSYYLCMNDKLWKVKSAGWESAVLHWEASAVCVLWDWSWMNLNKWIYVPFPVIRLSSYNEEITQRNGPEQSSEFTFAHFLHLNNLLTKVWMFHEDSSIIHYCFSLIRGVQASGWCKSSASPHSTRPQCWETLSHRWLILSS